jgi:hypothetical protein
LTHKKEKKCNKECEKNESEGEDGRKNFLFKRHMKEELSECRKIIRTKRIA